MELVQLYAFVIACISLCKGRTLTEILSYYETLNKVDFHHRIFRRSLPDSHGREIDFVSHGKNFKMKLEQSRDIFDSSFRVVSVDRYGKETKVNINTDYFYKGYVEDDPSSRVIAHLEDNGLMTATIDTANETYTVEPMWRHVDKDPSHDVIVYKASDVKWNLTNPDGKKDGKAHVSTCGNNDTDIDDDYDGSKKRVRRDGKSCPVNNDKNTCKLHLVADYKFCSKIGRKNVKTTALYMLQVINRVNDIYRATCWEGFATKIGVQVKKVTVHCDGYTSKPRFNAQAPWSVDSLLTQFSREDWTGYCLAHLFTYQDFANGVIGLAYVGSTKSRYGGICSPKTRDRSGLRKHNCGLTSYVNWGRRLTTMEANLVTAHEIGHNFGSNHDKARCSNDPKGKYIMYATSVTGEDSNNRVFSPCSKEQIGRVLQSRKSCLEKKSKSRCHNSIVEDGEKCDEGDDKNNPCCRNCVLINGATCSDSNSMCCTNCQTTPANKLKICRANFTLGCEDATRCDGKSTRCPDIAPRLASGEKCYLAENRRKGKCGKTGKCVSLCGNNTKACPCQGNDACKVCCLPIGGGTCKPFVPHTNEGDGVECQITSEDKGLCDNGVCRKMQSDVKDSFKNLLTDFTLDKAVLFMQNNIVITILFFSLLIWVPAGLIVTLIDKLDEKKYKELEEESFSRQSKQRGSFKKKEKDRGRASRGEAS